VGSSQIARVAGSTNLESRRPLTCHAGPARRPCGRGLALSIRPRAVPGGRRPPPRRSGIPSSPGPARSGVERSGSRSGRPDQWVPKARGARVSSPKELCAPRPQPHAFTCARASDGQTDARRRGRRRPQPEPAPPWRCPELAGRGRWGRSRGAEPGWAPPEPRGPRAFLPPQIIKKFISWRIG
jgi:hypothetical protein